LPELTALHPLVHLVIVEGTSTSLEESILGGRLDLAVVDLADRDAGLKLEPLFDEDLLLVVLPGHPLVDRDEIDFTELDGMDLILPPLARHIGLTLIARLHHAASSFVHAPNSTAFVSLRPSRSMEVVLQYFRRQPCGVGCVTAAPQNESNALQLLALFIGDLEGRRCKHYCQAAAIATSAI
jgi:DNA-binding transcriptional LysR family regulator